MLKLISKTKNKPKKKLECTKVIIDKIGEVKKRDNREIGLRDKRLRLKNRNARMYDSDFTHRSPGLKTNGKRKKRASIFSPVRAASTYTPHSEPAMGNLPFSFHPNYNKNGFKKNVPIKPYEFTRGKQSPYERSPYRAKNFVGTSSRFRPTPPRGSVQSKRLSVPSKMRDSVMNNRPMGDVTGATLELISPPHTPGKRYIGDIYPGVGERKMMQERMNKIQEDFYDRNKEMVRKLDGGFDRYDRPGWRVLNQDPYFAPPPFSACSMSVDRKVKNSYFDYTPKIRPGKRTLYMSHRDIEREYERMRKRKEKLRRQRERKKRRPKWVRVDILILLGKC